MVMMQHMQHMYPMHRMVPRFFSTSLLRSSNSNNSGSGPSRPMRRRRSAQTPKQEPRPEDIETLENDPSTAIFDLTKGSLAPIPLYRRILRIHRLLPAAMRFMGDSYVKSEYRLHRSIQDPLQIIEFLMTWKMYLDGLEAQLADSKDVHEFQEKSALPMSNDLFDQLSHEQLGQLVELKRATESIWQEDPNKEKS